MLEGGGGRQAYTENQFETEVLPKLLRLQYVEMQSDNSFKLTEIGKAHCRRLRKGGLRYLNEILLLVQRIRLEITAGGTPVVNL